MKLELEQQKQISSLKENVSASILERTSAARIAKMPVGHFQVRENTTRLGQIFRSLCKSQTSCHTCKGKYHTSIFEKQQMLPPAREPGMIANHVGESAVIHPVVVVRVKGYNFRAHLDSCASHSYCSSTFVKLVKTRPKAAGLRQIAMLMV